MKLVCHFYDLLSLNNTSIKSAFNETPLSTRTEPRRRFGTAWIQFKFRPDLLDWLHLRRWWNVGSWTASRLRVVMHWMLTCIINQPGSHSVTSQPTGVCVRVRARSMNHGLDEMRPDSKSYAFACGKTPSVILGLEISLLNARCGCGARRAKNVLRE